MRTGNWVVGTRVSKTSDQSCFADGTSLQAKNVVFSSIVVKYQLIVRLDRKLIGKIFVTGIKMLKYFITVRR